MRSARAGIVAALAALAVVSPPLRAQDFALPGATPPGSAAALLEDALPRAEPGVAVTAGTIAWYGVPGLVTRALAIDLGRGTWRASCGVSQTGEPGLGWTTVGIGAGAAGRDWGAAGRVLARRDRTAAFAARVAPGEGGLEAGAGAWLVIGGGCTMWASAPSLAVTGAAPPLARALEAGVRWSSPGLALWLAHRSAPAGYGGASFAAGACAGTGPARVWLSAHDAPFAGTFGVSVTRAPVAVSAAVESHPWLPPLTRLALTLADRAP